MKNQKVTPVAAKPVEAAKSTVAINSAAPAPKSAVQSPVQSSATAEPAKAPAPVAPKNEIARSEAAKVDVATAEITKAEVTKAQVTKVEAVKVETQKPSPAVAAAPASEKKAVDTPAAKALVKKIEAAPVKAVEKSAAKVESKPAPAKVKVAAKAIEKPAAKVEAKPTAKAAPNAASKTASKTAPKTASAPDAATAEPAVGKPAVEIKKAAKPVRPALEDIIPEAPASAFSFPPAFNEKSLPRPETIAAPFATMMGIGADTARKTFEQAQEASESMRQACLESANAASRGIVALNTQMLDLVRAQTDATMDIWRSALTAPSLSEAVKIQTSGARQAYETTTAHLKVIAETTTRVVGETTKPIQTVLNERTR